jgi:hypothetical protein
MSAISRERAREIALARLARDSVGDGAMGISEVLSLEEVEARQPLIYGFEPDRLKNYWIVYVETNVLTIKPSVVILVSKSTGEIAFVGSAGDEG